MFGAVRHVSRHFPVYACVAYVIAACERIGETLLEEGAYYESRAGMMTQYFVNYAEHGFAKRALVGTLLHPLMGVPERPEHLAFWLMVALSLAGLIGMIGLVQRYLPHSETGDDGVVLLRCALAVGSLGSMQLAHDFGRFDVIGLALLVATLALVARGRIWSAAAVCVLAVLVHEAFAVYGAPLVLALGWHAMRRGRSAGRASLCMAPLAAVVAGACLTVLLYGNSADAAATPYGTGGYVWQRGLVEFGGPLGPWDVALLALVWGAVLGLYLAMAGKGARQAPLLLLAVACPLALNVLGIDHSRWLTLGFYVTVIALGAQARLLGWPLRQPGTAARRAGYLLCLPLGPMGVVDPLAWFP